MTGPRPRVDTHPPYVETYGPEAIELAAIAGLVLDPWQADALTTMLGVKPDGRWSCFEYCEWVSRQNGKGGILEARALAGLFLLGEELIMWSAHEYKTAMEAYRRVKRLIRALGVQVDPRNDKLWDVDGRLVKIVDTNGEEGLECLDTEQRLKFIARSKGSGRGFSGDVNIIDEAFAYTADQHTALLFTMGARQNPQLIYTSSPPLTGVTGDVMYGLRDRGDPTLPRTPGEAPWQQDDSLGYRDWGLGGELESLEVDLDDEGLWLQTNPALSASRPSALTLEKTRKERKAMRADPVGFARERLGIWPRRVRESAGAGVIPKALWEDLALDPPENGQEPERPTEVAFGVVVSADRSRTAIAVVGPLADGRMQAAIVNYDGGTHWVVDRMEQLQKKWKPVAWALQDKGPTGTVLAAARQRTSPPNAQPVFAEPEDREKPRRGELAVPWAADVAVAYGMFVDAVTERRVVHLGDTALDTAVVGAAVRALGSGTTWDYRSSVDVAPLQAVTLAHWAYVTRAHLVVEDRTPNLW